MSDATTREVEGRLIVTSGSLTCPAPDLCDVRKGERFEAYVERHCADHLIDMAWSEAADWNLGLNCFYFDHKYVYGNPTLTPFPFWEIHAFLAEDEWNEDDLEERVPIAQRKFTRIPNAADRRPGDVRSMKQLELPRQCEKTSAGAEAWAVFISKRQYFVNDERNYPIVIRSATSLNSRDSLATIRMRATRSKRIKGLYGVRLVKCGKCFAHSQIAMMAPIACAECGEARKVRSSAISLIDPTRGAGGTGKDSITFRWSTDLGNVDPDDEDAVYSVRAVGLGTEMTGQRPREYILDDIQTAKNSRTFEMRSNITRTFDEAVRQVEFGGRLKVNDTRKYVDDFAGKINEEPLRGLFHTLHRRVYWPTDEPDDPPYIVDGMRYYYPVKGNGDRALDAQQVAFYERQMLEREFAGEFLNDPTDPKRATFKREHFITVKREDAPPEIRFGLGCDVSPMEQAELDSLNLRIIAYNACDPAGIEEQKKRGDDNFIVCVRFDRYGKWYITRMAAGKWASRKRWDEVARAHAYNRPQFTDYELPASEIDTKDSFDKWVRDKREELSAISGDGAGEAPALIIPPMKFRPMPKSSKRSREDQMELFVPIYILEDACDKDLRDKYIDQWLGLGVKDHDDGPDATSRLIHWVTRMPYRAAAKEEAKQQIQVVNGAAHVPFSVIMKSAKPPAVGGLWGQQGGDPACRECGQRHSGACPPKEKSRVA